jgi:serine/threonine protein kinase
LGAEHREAARIAGLTRDVLGVIGEYAATRPSAAADAAFKDKTVPQCIALFLARLGGISKSISETRRTLPPTHTHALAALRELLDVVSLEAALIQKLRYEDRLMCKSPARSLLGVRKLLLECEEVLIRAVSDARLEARLRSVDAARAPPSVSGTPLPMTMRLRADNVYTAVFESFSGLAARARNAGRSGVEPMHILGNGTYAVARLAHFTQTNISETASRGQLALRETMNERTPYIVAGILSIDSELHCGHPKYGIHTEVWLWTDIVQNTDVIRPPASESDESRYDAMVDTPADDTCVHAYLFGKLGQDITKVVLCKSLAPALRGNLIEFGAYIRENNIGVFPVADAVMVGLQLARAVAACVYARVTHNDIKGDNVLVGFGLDATTLNSDRTAFEVTDALFVLTDFGIAVQHPPEGWLSCPSFEVDSNCFPNFAPEFIVPRTAHTPPPDASKGDVYGLGLLLWHLVHCSDRSADEESWAFPQNSVDYPHGTYNAPHAYLEPTRKAEPETALRRGLFATIRRMLAQNSTERLDIESALGRFEVLFLCREVLAAVEGGEEPPEAELVRSISSKVAELTREDGGQQQQQLRVSELLEADLYPDYSTARLIRGLNFLQL